MHHEGETVRVSIQLNMEMSPTINTDGVGCQKVGAVSFKPTKCHIQRERKKKKKKLFSYIKTERPGYISTFCTFFYYRNEKEKT